jgi:type VI secretion system secreted protein VgrG
MSMSETKQKDRILELETPLGPDVLLIERLDGVETISDLFRFRLETRSENKSIDPDKILGKGITVGLELYQSDDDKAEREIRYFHGMVERFGKTNQGDDNAQYRIEMVPWLALLSRRSNCRVFQDLTAVAIVKSIFDYWKQEYPSIVAYQDKTDTGKYRPRDYCVQYRETDFDFVSRLMEEEGIYYYFKHEKGKHTLILGDAPAAHLACPLSSKVRFVGDEGDEWQTPEDGLLLKAASEGAKTLKDEGQGYFKKAETDVLSQVTGVLGVLVKGVFGGMSWVFGMILDQIIKKLQEKWPEQRGVKVLRVLQQIRSGRVTLRDHHFEMPRKSLEVAELTLVTVGDKDKLEIYDYPGGYAKLFNKPSERLDQVEPEGKKQVRLRMEGEELLHWVISGVSREGEFTAGHYFDLTEHKHTPTNSRYVLTSVEHSILQASTYKSGDNDEIVKQGGPYRNRFTCIPASWPYRPLRKTPKAVVHGPQTATVDGKQDEEIWVDKYGRVRVTFHWDRDPLIRNEKASCWIRVAQMWAGKRWGAFFWPRMGQEVVVDFLEGDPDRPIIVGSVYNYEQMPPYMGDGPDSKHPHDPNLSGIKTCSTKGGAGFNELRFDDRKDNEQIFWHAQRDRDSLIRRDDKEWIGHERHLVVGIADQENQQLHGDQFETIGRDNHVITLRDHREHIAGKMELRIGGDRGRYLGGPDVFGPGEGSLDLAISGGKRESVGGDCHHVVKANRLEKIDGSQSLAVGGDQNEKVGSNHALDAGECIHLKAGVTVVIEAGAQISLKAGGSFVDINSGGVYIQGPMVYLNSGGAPAAGAGAHPAEARAAKEAEPTPAQTPDVWTARPGFPSAEGAKAVPSSKTPDQLWPLR